MDDFDAVYWEVVAAVEAPPESLAALLPELRDGHNAGSTRRMHEAVRRHLPDNTWIWPTYEAQTRARDEQDRREDIKAIRQSDIWDFLSRMRLPELRALFRTFAPPGAPSPGRGRAQMVPAVGALLTPQQADQLLARLRQEALAEYDEPGTPDYHEMGVLLCRRITAILYHRGRYAQLNDPGLLSLLPRWRFHWGDEGAKACRKFNRKVLSAAEAKETFPAIPCECLECGCHISAEK